MTKYEWEKELRKNISRLPADEVSRILDYYSELFEDKAEGGYSEKEIMKEFGNPFDVAYKILREFDELGIVENESTNVPKSSWNAKDNSESKSNWNAKANIEANSSWDSKASHASVWDKTTRNSIDTQSVPKYNGGRVAGENLCVSDMQNSKKSDKKVKNKSNAFATFMKFLFILPFFIISVIFWPIVVAMIVSGGAIIVAGVIEIIMSFVTMGVSIGAGVVTLGIATGSVGLGIICIIMFIKLAKFGAKATSAYIVGKKEKNEEME